MEALRTHVAGVDVHKEVLAITVLIEDKEGSVQEIQFNSKTFTEDLIKCGRKFLDLGVKEVAMESTGVYWKPLYNVWHPMGIKLTIGQAAHIKNVPGRKTDMNDSEWIARLHRYGLIRASLIPQEFQRIRYLIDELKKIPGIDEVLAQGILLLFIIIIFFGILFTFLPLLIQLFALIKDDLSLMKSYDLLISQMVFWPIHVYQ